MIIGAVLLTLTLALWLPLAVVADLVRLRRRLPVTRLLLFALCWVWIELAGVAAATVLWLVGQRHNLRLHYGIQRWWAASLMKALQACCGIRLHPENIEQLTPGPTLLYCRHASLADSLVSAYVVCTLLRLEPRYVLKHELASDPCLDIVGHRIPNHFLDRDAANSAGELAAIEEMSRGIGANGIGVIFAEGTRANPKKRERALTKIAERDPQRAETMAALHHLLPPRPAGALAMHRGAPTAKIALAWHTGFEGLDTFGGMIKALGRGITPIRFVISSVVTDGVPSDVEGFQNWIDDQWLRMDGEVAAALKVAG